MFGWEDTETGDLILSADRDGLLDLASRLRAVTVDAIPLAEAENWPMARPIGGLSIKLGGRAVAITVTGDIGAFVGDVAGFERLAGKLETFAEDDEFTEPGSHIHLDPGDGVLGADSCPLVVAGPTPD